MLHDFIYVIFLKYEITEITQLTYFYNTQKEDN